MGLWDPFARTIGHALEGVGQTVHAPELGLSEKFGVHNTSGALNIPVQVNPNQVKNSGIQPMQGYHVPSRPTPLNPNPSSAGNAGGGGAGGGDSAAIGNLRNDISSHLLTALNGIYDSMFGNVDRVTQDKAGQLNQGYDQQVNDANKQYLANTQGIDNSAHGRGTFDSSFTAVDQGNAKDTYQNGLGQIQNNRLADQANLGQWAQSTKNQLQSQRDGDQYDLSQYTDLPTLQKLHDELSKHISDLRGQAASLGTQGDFVNALSKIAPKQTGVTEALKAQLNSVINSSAPPAAKLEVLKGYFKQNNVAPADQDYWLSQVLQTTAPKV